MIFSPFSSSIGPLASASPFVQNSILLFCVTQNYASLFLRTVYDGNRKATSSLAQLPQAIPKVVNLFPLFSSRAPFLLADLFSVIRGFLFYFTYGECIN